MGVTDLLLLSCLGFAITAHAQDCSVPDGGPNMDLKDEYIFKQTFASGDRAAFTCATGYHPEGGSSSITCTAGSWSTVRLKCERNSCGSPGELEHGHITYFKETLFGDRIEITCNDGYRLVGRSQITCGAQGWLDRLPRCEVLTCDPPPLVSDATFIPHKESYNFKDVVRYSCGGGLTLNGSALISCSRDGTFQPAPPTCTMVTCNPPPLVSDATFTPHKESYNFKDVVRYSCGGGLTLNGSALISCSRDGTFQPAPPTCIEVECKDLDILHADWISGSRPPHGHKATVEYKCRKGFKMVGQSTLICEINSQWSPEPPRCDTVYCEDPHVEDGHLTNDARPPYRPSDNVTYACSSFYNMEGEPTLTCEADGQWSSPPPKCTLSSGKVAGAVIGAIAGATAAAAAGVYGYHHRSQNHQKRLVEENPPKPEEEVTLLDGVELNQSPTGNGQDFGEGHRGQVTRKRGPK